MALLSSEPGAQPAEPATGQGTGDRVWIAQVREQDITPCRRAVEQSRGRLVRWNPAEPDDLGRALPQQSRDRRTFLVHALAPEGEHDIVGRINVTGVVRGRFESGAIGYDAYDPYAGRGLFAEGLRLVVNLLFRPEDAGGMGLHRVEAAVQPGNVRSAGLLRSLGFQREGFSPRMLWLPGQDGQESWRDHDSYVALRDEWPAQPYPTPHERRVVVLFNGGPGSGTNHSTLARQLAVELRVPLFASEVVGAGPVLFALLADSPVGGVVQGTFGPGEHRLVVDGLRRCGLEPETVPEVWCFSACDATSERPLNLGSTVAVDMGRSLARADVVRIALQVGAGTLPASEK